MSQESAFISNLLDQIPEIPENSIISRNLLKNPSADITLFGFAPGQELNEHTASSPAMIYFLEGDGMLVLGKDTQTYQPGSWAYMPARLPHAIQATTKTTMLLLLLRQPT